MTTDSEAQATPDKCEFCGKQTTNSDLLLTRWMNFAGEFLAHLCRECVNDERVTRPRMGAGFIEVVPQ